MTRMLRAAGALTGALLVLATSGVAAQGTGSVQGTVTRSDDGSPLVGVIVSVKGIGHRAVTGVNGRYLIERTTPGPQTLVFRWLGYKPVELPVTITSGGSVTVDAKMEPLPITLSDLVVESASKVPERAVAAPAAVTPIDPKVLQTTSITGQTPLALALVPGVDLAQNGVNDFNVNARGFNSSLNRRVLVLVDGRDVATAFLGSQEWNALAIPTEDIGTMEFVRGPGSALYGANAYAGVLNIRTPAAREVVGTKVSLGGGQLSTIKGDVRHAGLLSNGRIGYRVNVGYNRSDTWSRSRTFRDALRTEYRDATDSLTFRSACTSCPRREVRALNGQTVTDTLSPPSGDRDPLKNTYGSARVDYYADNGTVLTGEYGLAQVENETAVTGIGRVQISKTMRGYGRVNYTGKNFDVMGYWNGRKTKDPQYSLASGAGLEEESNVFHLEAQQNNRFADERGRFTFGGSFRLYKVDTERTLINPVDDDRDDRYYAMFSQLEYRFSDKFKGVLAARYDLGGLIDGQFSPKAAIVYNPAERHAIRVTFNKAFQTPNYSEFFLNAAAAAPADFRALEAGLRASALGPALAGVPDGALFDNSAQVPIRARGNANLKVEKNTGVEVGYRGDLSDKFYLSVDAYLNVLKDFVTDLLPGVNSSFPFWTAPAAVPAAVRGTLQSTVRSILSGSPATATAARGLTRQEDGRTAIVLSYANAGKATQYGLEFGAGLQLTNELRADGTFSLFRFDINEQLVGDQLLANTPRAKGNIALSYAGRSGFDASVALRAAKGFDWAAGVFAGYIEPERTVDASVGYDINNSFRVYATGVNIFDQERFAIYGGSVNGRRILGGVTARF